MDEIHLSGTGGSSSLAYHVFRTMNASGTLLLGHRSPFPRASSSLSAALERSPGFPHSTGSFPHDTEKACLRLIYCRLRIATIALLLERRVVGRRVCHPFQPLPHFSVADGAFVLSDRLSLAASSLGSEKRDVFACCCAECVYQRAGGASTSFVLRYLHRLAAVH